MHFKTPSALETLRSKTDGQQAQKHRCNLNTLKKRLAVDYKVSNLILTELVKAQSPKAHLRKKTLLYLYLAREKPSSPLELC